MNVVVLDLEMNQPSNNIIQVGAVLVNIKTNTILSSYNWICNPGELPSQYITDLTGITPEMVEKGIPIKDCLDGFWRWCEESKCGMQVWAWGTDVWEIKKQSQDLGVKLPPKLRALNVKEMAKLFRSTKKDLKISAGLKNTMTVFGLPFVGKEHNAYVDAVNTASLIHKFYKVVELYNVVSNHIKEN